MIMTGIVVFTLQVLRFSHYYSKSCISNVLFLVLYYKDVNLSNPSSGYIKGWCAAIFFSKEKHRRVSRSSKIINCFMNVTARLEKLDFQLCPLPPERRNLTLFLFSPFFFFLNYVLFLYFLEFFTELQSVSCYLFLWAVKVHPQKKQKIRSTKSLHGNILTII